MSPVAWVSSLLHLVLAVEVGARDVEAVDMGRDDAKQEEDCIDEGVSFGTREEEDC